MAGLLVDVYGLDETRALQDGQLSCLWLHHPRLRSRSDMAPFAHRAVSAWNERRKAECLSRSLIALAFDQRNHGSRLVAEKSNEAWRGGNPTHAQDMFGAIAGMVSDTSGLIDIVEGYVVPDGRNRVDQHLVLGVSLGGHSAWQIMFAEPRITAGVMIIGCPDYICEFTFRISRVN
jgi:hypothetical protein